MPCTPASGRKALCVTLLLFAFGGVLAARAGELEQRFADTLRRAEAGDTAAMYSAGEMYELGMGTGSDRAKAMSWYRLAADKGHPEGAYQIGYAYYWGKAGLDKDRRQAHIWFLRAAQAGSQAAMPYLAKMYSLGQGVPRDKQQAALWSARAAAGSSNLHSQPPAARPEPEPQPVTAPEPEAVPDAAAAAEQTPPAATPAAELQPQAASEPAAASRPAAKTAPKLDRRQRQMQRLLAAWWQKDGRPALYLPSSRTTCQQDDDAGITCQSQPRRSSLLGRPYNFRFRAYLESFDRLGRFTLRYWPEVMEILPAPPGAYGTGDEVAEPPSDEEVRSQVERPAEELACEMFKNTHMECTDSRGGELVFARVDRGDSQD
jgi:hypothetical protein